MAIAPYLSQQPVDDFGLRFAGLKYFILLSANTDTPVPIPGDAPRYKAVIKVSNAGPVWVALNEAALVPNSPTFAETTSELVLSGEALCREVKAGDALFFRSGVAANQVSVVLYALDTNN